MKKCDRRPQSAGAEAEAVRRYVGARSCGLLGVVIAYVAMSRGVALPDVVTILCTLGIYSVYSFLVVGKTISWEIAAARAEPWRRCGPWRELPRWGCIERPLGIEGLITPSEPTEIRDVILREEYYDSGVTDPKYAGSARQR